MYKVNLMATLTHSNFTGNRRVRFCVGLFTQNIADVSLLTESSQLVHNFLSPFFQYGSVNEGPETYIEPHFTISQNIII